MSTPRLRGGVSTATPLTNQPARPDPAAPLTSRLCAQDLLRGREHHEDRRDGRHDADGDEDERDHEGPRDLEVLRAECEVQSGPGREPDDPREDGFARECTDACIEVARALKPALLIHRHPSATLGDRFGNAERWPAEGSHLFDLYKRSILVIAGTPGRTPAGHFRRASWSFGDRRPWDLWIVHSWEHLCQKSHNPRSADGSSPPGCGRGRPPRFGRSHW